MTKRIIESDRRPNIKELNIPFLKTLSFKKKSNYFN